MCGGGGSAPRPEPTPEEKYRHQIGGFVADKQNQYNQQASDYNKQMDDYNSQFNVFYGKGMETYGDVQNLNLGNMNENSIADYRSSINSSMNDYNTLLNNYDSVDRPDFQTNYNGFNWGGTYIPAMASVEAPALKKAKSSYQLSSYDDGYEKALGHLDRLENNYNNELGRIDGFKQTMRSGLSHLNEELINYGIRDIDQINSLERALGLQKRQLGEFSTPLANADFSFSNDYAADLQGQIDTLQQSYADETQRIGDFQNALNTSGQNWASTLGNLNITNGDLIGSLNTDIDRMIFDANNFKSELDTNFNMADINRANELVDNLQSSRNAELGRIATAEANASDTANWLSNTANSHDGYALNQIEAMQKQLDDQRANLTGFNSVLDFDYSDELSGLDAAQSALNELSGRRTNAINNLFSDQSSLLSQLNAIDLSDETGMKNLQDRIRHLQSQGNQYSGGRASDLNSQLGDLYTASGDKLTELYNYRGDLETQAQDLLSANQDVDFLDLDQLSGVENQFNDLNSLVSQYGASAAGDEISQLQSLLGQNRSRLEADAANVAAAQNSAASEITNMLDSSGNIISGNLPFNEFLTEEEYLALMQQQQEEEDNPFLNPTFAASVGIKA